MKAPIPWFISASLLCAGSIQAQDDASSKEAARIVETMKRQKKKGALDTLGEELGAGLFTAKQYWQLKSREIGAGDPSKQLAEGALSPEGINTIRRLFEASIQSALVLEGERPVVSELGGFAAFDGGLIFHEQPHFAQNVRCAIVERSGNLEGLLELYSLYPEEMSVIDRGGNLKKVLLSPRIPSEKRAGVVKKILPSLLFTAGHEYVSADWALSKSLRTDEWRGRFLGAWHTHPPEYGPSGWLPGEMSAGGNDLAAAVEGLEFMIVFLPDGFDLIDLFALKGLPSPDYSRIKKYSHRSEQWRRRFNALYRAHGSAQFAAARKSACR